MSRGSCQAAARRHVPIGLVTVHPVRWTVAVLAPKAFGVFPPSRLTDQYTRLPHMFFAGTWKEASFLAHEMAVRYEPRRGSTGEEQRS